MKNYVWRDTELQKSDLPLKVQRFVDLVGIDLDTVTILHLAADPDGNYIMKFRTSRLRGLYDWSNRVIALINNVNVGITIHELTHVYIRDNDIDTQPIVEKYMETYGNSFNVLSGYGWVSKSEKNYEEVVCEIVARFGRRGQFNKIAELLNI
jgi:hypothetical protein